MHPIGDIVCTAGHRYRLTVVGFGMIIGAGDPAHYAHPHYHLADETGPRPYRGMTVPARDVQEHTWQNLMRLSAPVAGWGYGHTAPLGARHGFLTACAHLHDLARKLEGQARRNADEAAADMMTEAAVNWWKDCKSCNGSGFIPMLRITSSSSGLYPQTTKQLRDPCKPCNSSGQVSRFTDQHRLRLVEALIAAGLPARVEPPKRVDRHGFERVPAGATAGNTSAGMWAGAGWDFAGD